MTAADARIAADAAWRGVRAVGFTAIACGFLVALTVAIAIDSALGRRVEDEWPGM